MKKLLLAIVISLFSTSAFAVIPAHPTQGKVLKGKIVRTKINEKKITESQLEEPGNIRIKYTNGD